jgi:hypothetical protein
MQARQHFCRELLCTGRDYRKNRKKSGGNKTRSDHEDAPLSSGFVCGWGKNQCVAAMDCKGSSMMNEILLELERQASKLFLSGGPGDTPLPRLQVC